MSIGEKIKLLRTEKKLTQRELAEAINYSHSYIGDLECNRTIPSIKSLERISEYFSVRIACFFEGNSCCNTQKLAGKDNYCYIRSMNNELCRSCPLHKN